MRPSRAIAPALATGVLALALAFVVQARAGDTPTDPVQLREHIEHGIADGLARHSAQGAPAPAPAISHPAPIAGRARVQPAEPAAAAPAADAAAHAPADTTGDGVWTDLLAGNQRFVAEHPRVRPLGRERAELEHGQHPRAIVLGCSDSRVSPELVFDQSLGDVFVVRTAGNIVDPIALGSIEYAAEHLHARLLVVLGHGGCGAVTAAAAGGDMPSAYLQAIVDRIRPVVQRLSPCFEGEELIERSVVANARQSAQDVLSNSQILREAAAQGHLKVVSAVYDLHTGVVTPVSAPAATAQASAPVH